MYWRDARLLGRHRRDRGYEVLEGFSIEEAAKFHILLDAARCPKRRADLRLRHLGYCADHLAKGIYAEYYEMQYSNLSEVERCVRGMTDEYYVDGPNGWDFILRNDVLTLREQKLYVDYVDYTEHHDWCDPLRAVRLLCAWARVPALLTVASALRRAGCTTPKAIEVISTKWGQVTIEGTLSWHDQRRLNVETLQELDSAGLLRPVSQRVIDTIVNEWRLPLYHLNLRITKSNIQELREAQKRMFWRDVVGGFDY